MGRSRAKHSRRGTAGERLGVWKQPEAGRRLSEPREGSARGRPGGGRGPGPTGQGREGTMGFVTTRPAAAEEWRRFSGWRLLGWWAQEGERALLGLGPGSEPRAQSGR